MGMTAHSQHVAGTSAQSAADAIDDLYRAHATGLVRFALMLVGDRSTAEDVVQVYVNTHVSLSARQNGDDLAVYGVSAGTLVVVTQPHL